MMRALLCLLLFPLLVSCQSKPSDDKGHRISLQEIEQMYSHMKTEGVYIDSNFRYGYYFISENKADLEKASKALEAKSFHFVDLTKSDEDETWWLQVERIEKHSAQSLFKLNTTLYTLASRYAVHYDGFDLGNVDPGKGLERDTYVVPDNYKVANIKEGGYPHLYVGNIAFDKFPHKEEFGYLLKITVEYEHDQKVMLPTDKELADLDQFEQNLEAYLTKHGMKNYYLFRETCKGKRNFYLVVKDPNEARPSLEQFKIKEAQRKISFEIFEDKQWSQYNKVRKILIEAKAE